MVQDFVEASSTRGVFTMVVERPTVVQHLFPRRSARRGSWLERVWKPGGARVTVRLVMYSRNPVDWERARQRKLEHWAKRYREAGPEGALQVAEDLREHMRRLRSDWPTAEDRERDLEHHLKMRAMLDKAAHALVFHARLDAPR